jgi:hypothetical protein
MCSSAWRTELPAPCIGARELPETLPAVSGNSVQAVEEGNMKGASIGGTLWFAGWLFSIGFAHLAWWKIILGIVVWPYFLGTYLG